MKYLLSLFLSLCLSASGFGQSFQRLQLDNYSAYLESLSASWADINGDGHLDLFITNATAFQNNECYINDGKGGFNNLRNAITQMTDPTYGACFGDYDNDGDLDLYLAKGRPEVDTTIQNELFYNNGTGAFIKVKTGAPVEDAFNSYACAWVDYNQDGWLDLFVANADNQPNQLYRNDGNGSFIPITEGTIVSDTEHNIGCSWVDYDKDGDPDLMLINPEDPFNSFYENLGAGSFQKKDLSQMGFLAAAENRGASWADFDNDGWLDVVLVDGGGLDRLYRNLGDGSFAPLSETAFDPSPNLSGYGSAWGDFDNDGDQDLILMHQFEFQNEYHQNKGDGTFIRLTENVLNYDNDFVTSSIVAADFDEDGRLDLAQTNRFRELYQNYGWPNYIYRNAISNCHNFLAVSLRGEQSNSRGIGSRVHLYYKNEEGQNRYQMQEMQSLSGGGYTAQGPDRLHFGLGSNSTLDSIVVNWPSGISKTWEDVSVNTHLFLFEDGDFLDDSALHQLEITAERRTDCPGDIHQLEVSSARGSVKWYVDPGPPNHISVGSVLFVTDEPGEYNYTAVDACGRSTSVLIQNNKFESRIFPNPSNGELFLNLATHGLAESASVRVSDAQGRFVWEQEYELESGYNILELDLTANRPGVYFVEIKSACYSSIEKVLLIGAQ
ncbi:MAG: T9SS type A sorting domain-containing protein [Bacteroidetes bacterium]|nr:T9SS type A sorting domain-containing protein [Bacteroidota bacterium]